MNWPEWFALDWRFWGAHALVLFLFTAGLIGCLLPILPGTLIVWLGILAHRLLLPLESVSWAFVWWSGAFMALTLLLDFLLAYWGGKRFGGSWKGGVGAIIGGLVGLFLPPPLFWIIIGPPIGAIIGELIARQGIRSASRAGWGTFLGGMASYVIKLMYSVALICLFYLGIFVF